MAIRNPSKATAAQAKACATGSVSLQLLVILVPVIFGLMGFALDLGRIYLIKGELNQAASAMALNAAAKLIGTAGSLDNATAAANLLLDDTTGNGAKYNFGMLLVGQTTGLLASTVNDPAYYATLAAATGTGTTGNDQADGTTAKHVVITLQGDAPLLFWSLLSAGQSRKTTVGAQAIAGVSAPLCTACNIPPIAVAAIDSTEPIDLGFVQGTKYTFYYQCNIVNSLGVLRPSGLVDPSGSQTQALPFAVVDRYDANSVADETQQLFRNGAQGMAPSTTPTLACLTVQNATLEALWSAVNGGTVLTPTNCNLPSPAGVIQMACGLNTRLDTTVLDTCQSVTDVDTLAAAYPPDSDTASYDDYTAYTGTTRRVITIPIVDTLDSSGTPSMTVLGFRQFLIEPGSDGATIEDTITDTNTRFLVMYLGGDSTLGGNPVPLKSGRFDNWQSLSLGCMSADGSALLGPGKVVLHQ